MKEIKQTFDSIFKETDLLIAPIFPKTNFSKNSPSLHYLNSLCGPWAFTIPALLSGNPSLTFTAGYTEEGYPISIQLIASHYKESLLFQVANFLETTYSPSLSPPKLPIDD